MTFFTLFGEVAGFVAVPNLLGYASDFQMSKASLEYYRGINKPFWSPPRMVFKPMWTLMLFLNGVSSFLVWREGIQNGVSVRVPMLLYTVQLLCALMWSPVFFRMQSPALALLTIVTAFGLAVITTLAFAVVSMSAAKLLLPYTIWLAVLACFNKCVWRMNPKPKKKRSKQY